MLLKLKQYNLASVYLAIPVCVLKLYVTSTSCVLDSSTHHQYTDSCLLNKNFS
uniref:Uncharacterized protein n=1 Tax=Arundo donax TaxID=35708 RepID=A0A0A9EGB6_ARUDO